MGCAEDTIEGLRSGAELRSVGLADDDGAGLTHARDQQVILGRHVVFVDRRPEGGSDPRGINEVLVRNRQTVEWAKRLTARLCLVRPGCGCGSFFGGQRNDCVDLRIDTIDLLKVLGKSFAGGELLSPDERGHLDCRGETERGRDRLGVQRRGKRRGERSGGEAYQDVAAGRLVLLWGHGSERITGKCATEMPSALSMREKVQAQLPQSNRSA